MVALQRKLPSLKKEARRDVVLGRAIDGDGEVGQKSALAVLRGPRLGLTAEECRKVGGGVRSTKMRNSIVATPRSNNTEKQSNNSTTNSLLIVEWRPNWYVQAPQGGV